jgi:hypothetical protein
MCDLSPAAGPPVARPESVPEAPPELRVPCLAYTVSAYAAHALTLSHYSTGQDQVTGAAAGQSRAGIRGWQPLLDELLSG